MTVVLGSPSKIPVQDVVATQHLRCQVNGELPINPGTLVPVFMDIYTGWILVGIGNPTDDVARDAFVSFVPLGTKTGDHFDVQGYPDGTTAIVSASIASFGDHPGTCAIDSATVRVRFVPDFSAGVLVLTANYAIQNGILNRVAYQVTVFAPPEGRMGTMGTFNKVALPVDTIVPT